MGSAYIFKGGMKPQMNLGVLFSCQGYEENLPVEKEQPMKAE